jgi:hypothetical protein
MIGFLLSPCSDDPWLLADVSSSPLVVIMVAVEEKAVVIRTGLQQDIRD